MNKRLEFRLNKTTLESLPAPELGKKFSRWWVQGVPGLCVRVMASGVKSYLFVRRIGNRTTEITLGKFPAMPPELAKRKAMEMNAQAENGIDPADKIRGDRQELTINQAFELYMQRHAKAYKRTWAEDERRWQRYLADEFGRLRVSELSRSILVTLHIRIGQQGLNGTHPAPVEANRVIALISCLYSKLIDWEIAGSNPATGIKKFREEKRDRFLKNRELPDFFRALATIPHSYARDFFMLLLLTGARKSNVLQMRWQDIEFDEAVWRIPRTKNGEAQLVPLVPAAIEILRDRFRSRTTGWVFSSLSSDSGHMEEPKKAWVALRLLMTCYRLIRALAKDSGWTADEIAAQEEHAAVQPGAVLRQLLATADSRNLPFTVSYSRTGKLTGEDIRIHDLRRTLGSWQAINGSSLAIIGKSLNHKTPQATAIYARLDLDPVRMSVEIATSAMLNAGRNHINQIGISAQATALSNKNE